jgi:hypothetical protein
MSAAADKANASAGQARGTTGWLAFAASPTFALMAWIAANDASPMAFCSSSFLPLDGMTVMYLLMSLFHLSPWLKLVSSQS